MFFGFNRGLETISFTLKLSKDIMVLLIKFNDCLPIYKISLILALEWGRKIFYFSTKTGMKLIIKFIWTIILHRNTEVGIGGKLMIDRLKLIVKVIFLPEK